MVKEILMLLVILQKSLVIKWVKVQKKVVMFGLTAVLKAGFLGQVWFLTHHPSLSSLRWHMKGGGGRKAVSDTLGLWIVIAYVKSCLQWNVCRLLWPSASSYVTCTIAGCGKEMIKCHLSSCFCSWKQTCKYSRTLANQSITDFLSPGLCTCPKQISIIHVASSSARLNVSALISGVKGMLTTMTLIVFFF